jgi:diguanylate cyclase (GGDEF)-like protein
MADAIRVLVVEHHKTGGLLGQQLLEDFGLDFTWSCVASEPEMRTVAEEFNPTIVLCVDETAANASRASLDMLRLLTAQAPVILISELSVSDGVDPDGPRPDGTRPGGRDADAYDADETLMRRLTATATATAHATAPAPSSPALPSLQHDPRSSPPLSGSAPQPHQSAAHLPRFLPSILDESPDLVVMSDADGWITYANISACRLLGASSELSLVTLLDTSYIQCLRAANWLDVARESSSADDVVQRTLPPVEHVVRGHRLHRLGFTDDWTRFPPQAHVNDLIGCLTARGCGDHKALALVGLNLDGLRLLNEAYGRAMGDEVISHVGSVLQSDLTPCGMAARVGQDDFLIVLPELSYPADAVTAVHGVLEAVEQRQPLAVVERRSEDADVLAYFLGNCASSGSSGSSVTATATATARAPAPVASAPIPESDTVCWGETPVRAGDTPGAGNVRSRDEVDLDDAIHRDALSLHFQPQFELQSGRGCGMEVLARWVLSSGENMAPAVFIPIAERGGLIRTLGEWVLHCACETAAAWRGRDAERLTLSVNVSTSQIDAQLYPVLAGILKRSGFPAQRLELEISETALIANTQLTAECLRQWKELGVRIAVNHFGADYSSLSYLSRLPVDRLKLDKTLIHDIAHDKKRAALTHAVISLGAELGVDVIAEGVETEPQWEMLAGLGCPQVQGYLLARPMPATQAQVALRKTWGNLPKTAFRPRASVVESHAS